MNDNIEFLRQSLIDDITLTNLPKTTKAKYLQNISFASWHTLKRIELELFPDDMEIFEYRTKDNER